MKRLFTMSALTSVVLVAGGLGLASCSDELNIEANGASQDAADILYDDLTCGWNLLIWNADTLQRCNIPLNTKLPVVVKSKNSNLSYEQVLDSKGRSVLCPHFTSVADKPDDLQSDRLHITVEGHPELGEKEVCLFIHPYIVEDTRATETMTKKERIQERAGELFSYGVNYDGGLATICRNPWFKFSKEDLNKYVIVQDLQTILTTYKEQTIDSLDQDRTKWEVGVSFTGALPKQIGFLPNINVKGETKTIDNKHYVTGTRTEHAADVTLNWLELLTPDDKNHLPLYFSLLAPAFYNALNNPGSPQYQEYDFRADKGDKKTGDNIFRLLQDFGSVYPIQAALGGRGTFWTSRNENISEFSLDVEVSVMADWSTKRFGNDINRDSATIAGYDGDKLQALVELQKFRNNLLSEKHNKERNFALKGGIGKESSKTIVNSEIHFEYQGGEVGAKMTDWTFNQKDPEQWTVIEFQVAKNSVSDPMKSIELFFVDPSSDRCKEVKAALTNRAYPKYRDEKSQTRAGAADDDVIYTNPFYQYLDSVRGLVNLTHPRMVLADILMVALDGPEKKDWQPLEFAGPDEKVRTYYPLRANVFSPNVNDVNYVLRTDKQDYIDAFWLVAKSGRDTEFTKQHCWYYALDYEDQCPGIVDIQFLKDGEYPEYYRNKECANSNAGYPAQYAAAEPVKVAMKLGRGMNTPYEDKIKSFGLIAIDGPQSSHVFGSSPMWNELPRNPEYEEEHAFWEAWIKEFMKEHITDRDFYDYSFDVRQKTKFRLIWSYEPLKPIRSYYKKEEHTSYVDALKLALPMHR